MQICRGPVKLKFQVWGVVIRKKCLKSLRSSSCFSFYHFCIL
jgi:hypothetical protein